jgi:hypothetical protein
MGTGKFSAYLASNPCKMKKECLHVDWSALHPW